MVRPKHPKKDLESLLRYVEDHGWRVERTKKAGSYYKTYCPCGVHKETVHLSPSDPGYAVNKKKKFERAACWDGEAT